MMQPPKTSKLVEKFRKKGDQDGSVMGLLWGEAGANLCFLLNLYLYLLCHCLCICIWGSVGVSNGLSEGCGRCSNFKHFLRDHLTNTCFKIVFQGDALNCMFSIQFYHCLFNITIVGLVVHISQFPANMSVLVRS